MSVHFLFLAAVNISENDIKVPKPDLTDASITGILQVVFGVAGSVALIILILAGLKYSLSLGDTQQVAKAKDAIIYAAIGLFICALAFSIVTFILGNIGS
jgi:lysylphosphatidylglycerol synthetase-like protein (DUF2156 family)